MTTTFLFPSTLQGLSDVSVSPGAGQDGYPLVWDDDLERWVVSLLPYSSLTGVPILGTMAAQNANAVAIAGGQAQNLTAVSQLANGSSSNYQNFAYSSGSIVHMPLFLGYRARGSSTNIQPVNNGDWLFFLGGVPRGSTNWSSYGSGFLVVANQDGAGGSDNNVPCRVDIRGVNPSRVFGTWMALDGVTANIPIATPSTSTTTGAFTVAGGAGIAGALHVGGQINGLGAVQPGTPASVTAAGAAGQIRWDADYIYVCIAANTWKRAAISNW